MINVLYIHGLGSSSASSTGKYLERLNDDVFRFHHPSFSHSPVKAMKEIDAFIKERDINLVVGSSLGGFYALQCACPVGVVINPALTPIKDLQKAFGYGEFPRNHGEGTYVLDETFYEELETVIRRHYDDVDRWFESYPKDRHYAGIFGDQDPHFSHYEDFHAINREDVTLLLGVGHQLNKESYPILRLFIDAMAETYLGIDII